MSLLGGELGGMDEAKERKATLYLEGNQLGLLMLENPQVGQCFDVCAELCIESISNYDPQDGSPPKLTMRFKVESIMREEKEPDPQAILMSMYPNSPSPS